MDTKVVGKKNRLLISKKKLIINIVIILIVTGLTIYTLVSTGAFNDLSPLSNLTWWSFLAIIGIIIFYIATESFVIYRQFRRVNPKMKYVDCVGTYLIANLGSNITPAKSGHHPFRLFYLEKKGNSFSQGLANATQCQIIYTIVQLFLYGAMTIVCAIKNVTVTISGTVVPLYLVGLIGMGLALIASLVFLVMAFVPPISKLIVRILAWVNVKTKKYGSKEEYILIQNEKMKLLKEQIIIMFTHFWENIPSLISYTFSIIASNCLPYFIYLIINVEDHVHFDFGLMCYFFALYQCISYISNIVPIPGNSGGAEALFKILFANVIVSRSELNCTLLMWRFTSYYLVLLVEAIFFISYSIAHDTKKELKLQKILKETQQGYTPQVHSHFDTMEMELLSVNFKNTQCYNCCHLQNNLFQCDKYKDKPDDILKNQVKCPFFEERNNGEDL